MIDSEYVMQIDPADVIDLFLLDEPMIFTSDGGRHEWAIFSVLATRHDPPVWVYLGLPDKSLPGAYYRYDYVLERLADDWVMDGKG